MCLGCGCMGDVGVGCLMMVISEMMEMKEFIQKLYCKNILEQVLLLAPMREVILSDQLDPGQDLGPISGALQVLAQVPAVQVDLEL